MHYDSIHCYNCKKYDTCGDKVSWNLIVCDEYDYFGHIHRYCFSCKKVTTFELCPTCGKYFCLAHAIEETDGDWESGYHTYSTHEGCD